MFAFQLKKPGTHTVSFDPAQRSVAQIPATQLPEGRHKTLLICVRIHPGLMAGTHLMHLAAPVLRNTSFANGDLIAGIM